MTTFACRVPAPPPPEPYVRPERPAPQRPDALWFGASEPQGRAPTAAAVDARPPRNLDSPLGVNLPAIGPDMAYVPFTDCFRASEPFRAVDWDGRPHSTPLDLDETGAVRRLARRQFAQTRVPVRPGARYVLSYRGDGRIGLDGVSERRTARAGRIAFRADRSPIVLRVERTSPSSPIRDLRVLPERFAEAEAIPLFSSDFLDRIERFSVLRFAAWGRVGGGKLRAWSDRTDRNSIQAAETGVAYEHMLDLAKQLGAEPWIAFPFAADDNFARQLAELSKQRLGPGTRLWLEFGDEAWSPDLARPGVRHLQRAAASMGLDPDPTVARLFYQSRRSKEVFRIFAEVLGRERLVRVISAPLGAPATVRLLLRFEGTSRFVDVVAVSVQVGSELGASEELGRMTAPALVQRLEEKELPETIAQLRAVAKTTSKLGVDLVAYTGGLSLAPRAKEDFEQVQAVLEAASQDAEILVLTLALLDAWRAVGGRLFVFDPLFGKGRALKTEWTSREAAPQYEAALRFSVNAPRWWPREASKLRPAAQAEKQSANQADLRTLEGEPSLSVQEVPRPEPELLAKSPPPEPKLYTAPWVKWVSLGLGVALGGFAVERFAAAEDAADRRDQGLLELGQTSDASRFDALQGEIRDAEDERELSQGLGFAAVGLASAFLGWALVQWLEEPPEPELPSWAGGRSSVSGPSPSMVGR